MTPEAAKGGKPQAEKLAALARRRDRDAWIRHAKDCMECREKTGICEAGRPLLQAAVEEMGDGK